MAGTKIRGITIELDADASGINKALKGVNTQLKTTQATLKDVDKLLKLNPGNVDLLRQKQKALGDAINQTKEKLNQLKEAQGQVAEGSAEWDAIQREIIDTENQLKRLQKAQKDFGNVASQVLKAAGQKVKDFGGKVEEAGKKLSGISGAAGAIGGAMLKLGYDAAKSADELNTLSKQTGISTDELQKMQYAADLVDVSVEDMTGAMRKLKTKIDPANETLASLGVSVTDASGELRSADEVFYDTVDALSKVANETERDQLAMELFGKGADSLAGIIDDGGAAFREFGQEAENLGLILDKDTLDSLNETNDTIDRVKANLKGTAAQIGADVGSVLAPLLEKGATLIGNITAKLRELTPEQTETILKVVGIVAAVAPAIIVLGKVISGIGSVISVLGTVVGVLGGPLTLAIAAAVAIGVVLYKNWDKIKETAIKVKDGVVEAWNNVKESVSTAVTNLKEGVTTAWENIKSTVEGVIDTVKEKIDSFKAKFDELKEKVSSVWETIKGILTGQIALPHIPLPHFKVSPPGWKFGDLLKGSIPSLSIDWYRKAYDNPVMFTSPTVLATPGGYKGFGDGTGAEIVMGLDKLREMVGSQNVNVTVVLEGDARGIFKVVQKTNTVRTRATNYNALAVGG